MAEPNPRPTSKPEAVDFGSRKVVINGMLVQFAHEEWRLLLHLGGPGNPPPEDAAAIPGITRKLSKALEGEERYYIPIDEL